MSTLTLRNTKGSPLTIPELDANFSNLNTDKLELNNPVFLTGLSIPTVETFKITTNNYPAIPTTLNLNFVNYTEWSFHKLLLEEQEELKY